MNNRRGRGTTSHIIEKMNGIQSFQNPNRVDISGISMPKSLADEIFSNVIKQQASQKLNIDPNYRLLLETYFSTKDKDTRDFLKEEMSALREKSDLYTKGYLEWFESNVDSIGIENFGKIALYCEEQINVDTKELAYNTSPFRPGQ
jgi:hypothetical protein